MLGRRLQAGSQPEDAGHRCRHGRKLVAAVVVLIGGTVGSGVAVAASGSPTVSVGAISTAEGQALEGKLATFTDSDLKNATCAPAGDYSASVQWGDSASGVPTVTPVSGPDQNGLCTYEVTGGHTWSEAGRYTIDVSVTGPNSAAAGTGSGTATISDAALNAGCSPLRAVAGSNFSGTVADLTDANRDARSTDYSVTVDWGDGSTGAGSVSAGQSAGSFSASGSHTWATPGSFTVTTRIADVDGANTQASCTVTVSAASNAPFSTFIAPPPAPITTGSMARFGASASPPAGTHVVAYHWSLTGPHHFDIDTGSTPRLAHIFPAGHHEVWMQAIDSAGTTSTTSTYTFTASQAAAAQTGCLNDMQFGWIEIITPTCIQIVHPGPLGHRARASIAPGTRAPSPNQQQPAYYVVPIPASGISLNGLNVTCAARGKVAGKCSMTISPAQILHAPRLGTANSPYWLDTSGPVRLEMLNTMNGPISLGVDTLGYYWDAAPPAGANQVPFDSVTLPGGQQFGYTPLSGTADIALTRPDENGFGVAVTINVDLHLFGQHFTNPVTLGGSSAGDMATAPGDWSVDLSGLTIPPLVYFNSLQVSYQDHLQPEPGYTGPELDHVYEASGSATILLTGWTIEADVIVANNFPIYVHFGYDHGNGSSLLSSVVDSFFGLDTLDATFRSQPYFEIGGEVDVSVGHYKVGGGLDYSAPHGDTGFQLFLDGQVPIVIPGVDITLGVTVTGPPTAGFGASGTFSVDYDPVFSAEGGLYLYVGSVPAQPQDVGVGAQPDMEFGIHARMTVIGLNLASARGFINGQWLAGCGQIFGLQLWGVAPLVTGEAPADGGFGGCDHIAPYSIAPELAGLSSVRGHAAAAGHFVQVPRGVDWANLQLISSSGAPDVHIVGPGMDSTTPVASGASRSGSVSALISAGSHMALIGLHNPAAGRYTITPVTGSPELTAVNDSLATATTVRAKLTGHGFNRALRFNIPRRPGQRVVFVERSAHGTVKLGAVNGGGRGTMRFHPAAFAGRTRTIVALPTLDGMPRAALVVARYRAPAPLIPAAPHRLTMRFSVRKGSVLATWPKVTGAVRYKVSLSATGGRRMTLIVSRNRLSIRAVFPGTRLQLTVRGESAQLRMGRVRSASLHVAPLPRRPPRRLRVHR